MDMLVGERGAVQFRAVLQAERNALGTLGAAAPGTPVRYEGSVEAAIRVFLKGMPAMASSGEPWLRCFASPSGRMVNFLPDSTIQPDPSGRGRTGENSRFQKIANVICVLGPLLSSRQDQETDPIIMATTAVISNP
jgi:hypothetical protein